MTGMVEAAKLSHAITDKDWSIVESVWGAAYHLDRDVCSVAWKCSDQPSGALCPTLHNPLDNPMPNPPIRTNAAGSMSITLSKEQVELEPRCIPVYINQTQVTMDSVGLVKRCPPRVRV